MASTCGVCKAQPSKYKCPKCDLPYCSLPCYRPHKESHANDVPVEKAIPTEQIVPVPEVAEPVVAHRLVGSNKIDFSGLEDDPDLLRLMSRYPALRIQLQSVYGYTLEPPPSDSQDQPTFNHRGRGGRGRGRGGRGGRNSRGGRGDYGQQPQQSQWTQAKGEKEAANALKDMRNKEGDTEGLAEFVQLITMKYGKGDEQVSGD
ncbi:hypothetical protein BDV97DRAFT_402062 [Delphinella strobiligena]|nr:hypothetical protein BDV97DRAFT_402062 [Delphinella strobiligena]